MLSPHDPDDRQLVHGIVHEIGTEVGLTTLVRVGRDGPAGTTPHAVISQYAYGPDINLDALLTASAMVEAHDHTHLDLSACALVLPDRDIAYVKHGDNDVTTLAIGPHPHDDPATHQVVAAGLSHLIDTLHAVAGAGQPRGRPFLTIAVLPPDSGPHPPARNGWQQPTAGPDPHRPHR